MILPNILDQIISANPMKQAKLLDRLAVCYPGDNKERYDQKMYEILNRTGHWKTSGTKIWDEIISRIRQEPDYYQTSVPLARCLVLNEKRWRSTIPQIYQWLMFAIFADDLETIVLACDSLPPLEGELECCNCALFAISLSREEISRTLIQHAAKVGCDLEEMCLVAKAVMSKFSSNYLSMLDLRVYFDALQKCSLDAEIQVIQFLASQQLIDVEWWQSLLVYAVMQDDLIRVNALFLEIDRKSDTSGIANRKLLKSVARKICNLQVPEWPFQGIRVVLDQISKKVPDCAQYLFRRIILHIHPSTDTSLHRPFFVWMLKTYPIDLLARNCELLLCRDYQQDQELFLMGWFANHSVFYHGSRVHYYFSKTQDVVIGCDCELPIHGRCSFQIDGIYLYLLGYLTLLPEQTEVMMIRTLRKKDYLLAPNEEPIEIWTGADYQKALLLQPPQILLDYWQACHTSAKSARSAE